MLITKNIAETLDNVNTMCKELNIKYSVVCTGEDSYLVSREHLNSCGFSINRDLMEGDETSVYLFLVGVLDSSSSILYLSVPDNRLLKKGIMC